MGEVVFLTGATGFIGGELLKRLLALPDVERVYALARARDARDLGRRAREVLFKLYREDEDEPEGALERLVWLRGELTAERMGLAVGEYDRVRAEVTRTLHAAASTEFDLPEPEARRINLGGAERVLELAAGAPRLARHVHISTAYVAGRRSGTIAEEELPGPAGPFSNTYESTKAAAERMLRGRMDEVPITIARPSIVVGSSVTGRTYNFNVLYYPLKLINRGKLPIVPGLRETRLDIVPVDYVCDATIALGLSPGAEGGTFHLTAGEDAIPLAVFCDRVCGYYDRARRARGEPPLEVTRVVGPLRWRIVRWLLRRRLRGRAREQFGAFEVYLPYLLTEKRFDASRARALLGDRVPYPPVLSYLERIAGYAASREWGRRVSWDPALLESGAWSGTAARPVEEEDAAR